MKTLNELMTSENIEELTEARSRFIKLYQTSKNRSFMATCMKNVDMINARINEIVK